MEKGTSCFLFFSLTLLGGGAGGGKVVDGGMFPVSLVLREYQKYLPTAHFLKDG